MKLLLAVLALAAVTTADEKATLSLLESANNQFTASMFKEVVKSNPDKSVVISAFSVLPPLALLGFASEGESHEEILKAVGLPDYNTTTEVFSLLNSRVRSIKGVTLKMANRIYIPNDGSALNENFAAVSKNVFASEVKNVNFSKNKETASEINAWVEDQTNKRIKNLVDPNTLDANTKAVLVNAIYFKGSWKDKFIPQLTTERDFHVSKDKTIKLPTMHRKGDYKYVESSDLNAKILELPYEGHQTSLLVVLPNEIDGLAALEAKLQDPNAIAKATERMHQYEVDVYLPKFKIETTTNLKDVLINMGVEKLFDPAKANLNKLLDKQSGLFISDATQKAFIEVNEEGAEAAAGNEFGIAYLSAVISDPLKFKADHPFVFLLREGSLTLFNGVFRT